MFIKVQLSYQGAKMLSVRINCASYRQNMLRKRNDSRIQDEILTYRQIRLPGKFYQNDVHKHQQQPTMEIKNDSVDMDDVDGGSRQLMEQDSSDLDQEAASMVKGFEILQSLTDQKERKTGNASVSLHPDISDKEVLSNDIKQMVQNLPENKLKEKDDKARWLKSLENKLSTMYAQSVHQFHQLSVHISDLLEEHKVTGMQYRASKDEVKFLRGRIGLSDMRCNKLELLMCETMDEHEETKSKFRKQLALGRKRSCEIHDLNKEMAGKDKALVDMEKDSRREKEERVELEKINADALMNMQKELDDCRRALAHKSEQCNDLKEQNGILRKEKVEYAESLTILNERLDAQQHKSGQLEVDVKTLSMEKKILRKGLKRNRLQN